MKAGVNILNFGPGAEPYSLLKWAQVSEELGYHSVMISDHIVVTQDLAERYPEPYYDPFGTLTWLAGQTSRVMLGTTVCVLPYRHPVLMARLGANIDQFSGGRFIFGVGVGGVKKEFEVLGVPFKERGVRANDYLAAIETLWTNEQATYKGRFVSFENIYCPRPVQSPHPPVWVGGKSEAALRRAVRFGDGWHPNRLTLDWLRDEGLPGIRRLAEEAGKPVPAFCPRIRLNITDSALPEDNRPIGDGSLEQVQGDIAALNTAGAEHLILDWFTGDVEATRDHERGWSMLRLIAEQVLDLKSEKLR
jgi:probable F420-dependent oxidoreductase